MKNKELIFGDIIEDSETDLKYCVLKVLPSIQKIKNYLACLELSTDNTVINNINKLFDKKTINDFYFVGNMQSSLDQYIEAYNIEVDKEKLKKVCFTAKRIK